jgi:uncharacterized protein
VTASHPPKPTPMRSALWALTGLFFLRVAGQVLVEFFDVKFLPPSEEWFSGLIPYGPLLVSQILILAVQLKICFDFQRGNGTTFTPRPGLGKGLRVFGLLYLAGMIVRYVVRMSLYPGERWTGGLIPIFFHWVLAAFLLCLASHHLSSPSRRTSE